MTGIARFAAGSERGLTPISCVGRPQLAVSQPGLYIALDAHDSITLVGVYPSQLTSSNILPL